MNLSFILPVYNAQDFIRDSLKKLTDFLQEIEYLERIQIILVNDGSKDDTLKKIQEFISNFNTLPNRKEIYFTLVSYEQNKNIGFAIKEGIKKVDNEIVLIMDCDLPFKLDIITKGLNLIDQYDIVSVDRTKNKESYKVSFFRLILHKGLIKIIKLIFGKYVFGIPDFVAGFKIIRTDKLKNIEKYLISNTSLVHFEILLWANLMSYKICFVTPILDESTNKFSTYSLKKIFFTIIKIIFELIFIRLNLQKIAKDVKKNERQD
ncbi:MAG: glycosyltransferase family 2 protein [bacterium]